MNYYLSVWQKYAVFSGRASRAEYWYFTLFNAIVLIIFVIVDHFTGTADSSGFGLLTSLYWLASLLPSLAVATRRLHDTNRSAWWLLLGLVPLGGFVLLIFFVQDSDFGSNKYGPSPKKGNN